IIAVLAGGAVLYRRFTAALGEKAVIEVDNQPVQTVRLDPNAEKQIITVVGVRGDSLIEVDGQFIRMTGSACPDKICIHQGRKSQPGDAIVCIPNRVTIKIPGLGR
ncbi:MAG: NusG domain II-containing protein, partial [Peptococcaceae bacterium]|nr:NusG domain II-containing protein [Peptococcaceae bacterium]